MKAIKMKEQKTELKKEAIWAGSAERSNASVKRMLAHQIERAMAQQGMTRSRLAELMETSRAAINRLLAPDNTSLTLQTLEKVADVLGKKLHIFLND